MNNRWNVGGWRIDLKEGLMVRRHRILAKRQRPDERLLLVLKALIEHAGQTVTTESLLEKAWPDRVVSRDSVTTAIYQLRQLLGDNTAEPKYIASVPRRGYRLIAAVSPVRRVRSRWVVGAVAATISTAAVAAWLAVPADPGYMYIAPMVNFTDSPIQEPLFTAIESTLVSELIQTVPGRVRTDDGDDIALRLEAMMVQCDLGPTLVVRLMDTDKEAYIWSEAYNLDEIAASTERPSLVEQAAMDVGAAIP
jgi:DNA-binding winged helix-turn-helix (wHTH) protein